MLKHPDESDDVPYYGTYERLHVPVWATTREVLRAAQKKLRRKVRYARSARAMRHEFYRAMLAHHKRAWTLYLAVQNGEFGEYEQRREFRP